MALDREWATFQRELPSLLQEGHGGKVALIHGDAVDSIWPILDEALAAGHELFGLEPFMAQEITDHPQPNYFSRNVKRRQ